MFLRWDEGIRFGPRNKEGLGTPPPPGNAIRLRNFCTANIATHKAAARFVFAATYAAPQGSSRFTA